jgi:putative ABC transport system permease protein
VTGSDTGEVTRIASRAWRARHGVKDEDAVISQTMTDISDQIDTIFGAITKFMTFVAAISLLVGGIGVMNIMLVSVTERTREIGIRKSIGARTGAIMIQFLAEAAIISMMGGVVGVILGISVAAVACRIFEFDLVVNPSVVVMATVFSSAIGLFFGLHPARKAAKMRPIDALRV